MIDVVHRADIVIQIENIAHRSDNILDQNMFRRQLMSFFMQNPLEFLLADPLVFLQ